MSVGDRWAWSVFNLKGVLSTSNIDLTFDFFSPVSTGPSLEGESIFGASVLAIRLRCMPLVCGAVARSNDSILEDVLSCPAGTWSIVVRINTGTLSRGLSWPPSLTMMVCLQLAVAQRVPSHGNF